jgi:hypothetical protein
LTIFWKRRTMPTKIDETNKGKRVKLIYTDDLFTSMKSGAMGTYEFCLINWGEGFVMRQHSIKWDCGSNLMLLDDDKFEFVE